MPFGKHNSSCETRLDLTLRQVGRIANESGLNRPCRRCGQRESRKGTFFCSDGCRFWSKVVIGPGCWLWTASKTGSYRRHGGRSEPQYGQFTIDAAGRRQHIHAHVYSYVLAYGPLPDGVWVLHHCDTPPCVRPDHLFPGDHKANMADAAHKGRLHVARPTRQKLTAEQIEDVRRRVAHGPRGTASALAKELGVTKAFISQIVSGRTRQYDAPLRPSFERAKQPREARYAVPRGVPVGLKRMQLPWMRDVVVGSVLATVDSVEDGTA